MFTLDFLKGSTGKIYLIGAVIVLVLIYAITNSILNKLNDYKITAIHGDSNDFSTFNQVRNKRFDAVLIDAGHTDFNVAIDALFYAPLASKYIIFHDVQIPDVSMVFDWYCKQYPNKNSYRIVSSQTYGFGVIEV